MKSQILNSLGVLLLVVEPTLAGPIMAPIVHEIGKITATAPSGAVALQKGHAMPEQTSLKINSGSEIGFTPFPGCSVLVTENSQTTIEHLEFVREAEQVKKRAAMMRLDAGRLFYAIEKFKPDVTKFAVTTPDRVVAVSAKTPKPEGVNVAGVVELRGQSLLVTVLGGSVEVASKSGSPITINAGSIYTAAGNSAQIINLITGQFTKFDATGAIVESGPATPAELAAGRAGFQTTIAIAEQAITADSLSSELVATITKTLVQVNAALASDGLNVITTGAVGSTTGSHPANVAAPAFQLPGMTGAETANPANISGVVRSGER